MRAAEEVRVSLRGLVARRLLAHFLAFGGSDEAADLFSFFPSQRRPHGMPADNFDSQSSSV